jgi:hypothetical protein
MELPPGGKIPLADRAVIAERFLLVTPAAADEGWIQAHLALYRDERVREWLEARLVRFLARWHERWG